MCGILLARCHGNKDLMSRVCGLFTEQSPKLLAEIKTAIDQGDAKMLETAAHTLKGSLSHFGASRGHELALSLEEAGRNAEFSGTRENLHELEQTTKTLNESLAEFERTNT